MEMMNNCVGFLVHRKFSQLRVFIYQIIIMHGGGDMKELS